MSTASYTKCCVPSGLDFEAAGDSIVQLFALRVLSHCKHDVGVLSCLNVETVERVPTPLFGRLVRCSAHGPFFGRLWNIHVKAKEMLHLMG